MKKRIYQLSCFSFLLALAFTPQARAYDAKVDNIYYNIVNDEMYPLQPSVEVTFNQQLNATKQASYDGDIIIPESVTINDVIYSVIGIGDEAFRYSQNLKSIAYPASITYIGQNAFRGCANVPLFDIYGQNDQGEYEMLPIYIPDKVYVADSAFCESGLERVLFSGKFSISTSAGAVFKD